MAACCVRLLIHSSSIDYRELNDRQAGATQASLRGLVILMLCGLALVCHDLQPVAWCLFYAQFLAYLVNGGSEGSGRQRQRNTW